MTPLGAQPLTTTAFAPFGRVLEIDPAASKDINHGWSQSFDLDGGLDLTQQDGAPSLRVFHSRPLPHPIQLHQMERHIFGSQSFIPQDPHPWLVVVAPKGDFDATLITVFLARADQGVTFAPGTWHHFSLALSRPSRFLVIERKADTSDCEELRLDPPLQIEPNS